MGKRKEKSCTRSTGRDSEIVTSNWGWYNR